MHLRQIAILGSFAAGVALASAPLAAADNLTSTVDSEISTLNLLFQTDAEFAGVSSSDYALNADGFYAILPAAVPTDTPSVAPFSPLDTELFGVSPGEAGVSPDPSSLDVFNGALADFYDAYNAALYSLFNDSNLIPASDLIGSASTIQEALSFGSDAGAFTTFLDAGISQLDNFFGIFSTL